MTSQIITNVQNIKQLMYIPFALIITSIILIGITIKTTNQNALSALLGGYSGLFIGLLFVMILKLLFLNAKYIDMIPIIMFMILIGLLIYLISTYFDRIISGNVSSYYLTYSYISYALLILQLGVIFIDIFKTNLFSGDKVAKLSTSTSSMMFWLFYILNFAAVIIINVVLYFYSTQG